MKILLGSLLAIVSLAWGMDVLATAVAVAALCHG